MFALDNNPFAHVVMHHARTAQRLYGQLRCRHLQPNTGLASFIKAAAYLGVIETAAGVVNQGRVDGLHRGGRHQVMSYASSSVATETAQAVAMANTLAAERNAHAERITQTRRTFVA